MRISPHQHKSSPIRSGEDFYLSPAGAEGLGNQSSGGGFFLRREKAVHAPVSDHTRKRGRSVLSQHMEVTVEKSSAESMIDMVVDAKNREAWEAKHRATVDATMRIFDGLIAMLRETVEEDAKRREGGLR